jgi:hypothetical protein
MVEAARNAANPIKHSADCSNNTMPFIGTHSLHKISIKLRAHQSTSSASSQASAEASPLFMTSNSMFIITDQQSLSKEEESAV